MDDSESNVSNASKVFGKRELRQIEKDKKRIERQAKIINAVHAIKRKFRFGEGGKAEPSRGDKEPYRLSQDDLEQIRAEIENPRKRKEVQKRVVEASKIIKPKLPVLENFDEAKSRLGEATKRTLIVPLEDIGQFQWATQPEYFNVTEEGEADLRNLAYYERRGDYIVLPEEIDENVNGPYGQAVIEELLHYASDIADEIKDHLRSGYEFINEGSTRYYLSQVVEKDNLAKRLTRGPYMTNRLIGEKIWEQWVDQFGEERMALVYFGGHPLPDQIDLDHFNKGAVAYLRSFENPNTD